jgi:hypothetical protein
MATGERGVQVRGAKESRASYAGGSHQGSTRVMEVESKPAPARWWKKYDLPYGDYVGLESAALSIRDFDPGVFPGLLQTPNYARAVHEGAFPRLPDEVIEQRIEVRRRRQQVLDAHPAPELNVIVDEAVLHRLVGGPEVMAQQLGHVIEASERDNVSVRVIPYSAGAYPALDSTFVLLEFQQHRPNVVYVEGLAGYFYLKRPEEVEFYEEVYKQLSGIAMSTCESIRLMADVQAEISAKLNL